MKIRKQTREHNFEAFSQNRNDLKERYTKSIEFSEHIAFLIKQARVKNLPYQQGHLIRRMIYDKVTGGVWNTIVKPDFVDNCNIEQLQSCVDIANILKSDDTLFVTLCNESKGYRA